MRERTFSQFSRIPRIRTWLAFADCRPAVPFLPLGALVIAVLLPLPVRAQGLPDKEAEAKEHNRNGLALIDKGNFVEAVVEFKEAYADSAKPKYVFNAGRACQLMGQYRNAMAFYEKFQTLAISDEDQVQTRGLVQELKQRLVRLTVTVVPAEATLEVDGDPELCRTAQVCLLDPGSHVVRVSAADHAPESRKLVLEVGASHSERIALGRTSTKLGVSSNVPGARVFLDGLLIGVSPLNHTGLAAGRHKVRMEAEGYLPVEKEFDAEAGQSTTVSLTLEVVLVDMPTRWDVVWRSLAFPGLGQFHAGDDGAALLWIVSEGLSLATLVGGLSMRSYYLGQRDKNVGPKWAEWDTYVQGAETAAWMGGIAAAAVWAASAIHAMAMDISPEENSAQSWRIIPVPILGAGFGSAFEFNF